MHEIRATLPPEYVEKATQLARVAGIDRVAVSDIYLHGPDERRQVVSVETSTPRARAFVEVFLGSAELRDADYSLTSRGAAGDREPRGSRGPWKSPTSGRAA